MVVNQVRDDFGIGLGLELVPEALQVRALFLVVLDDAVVHHGDFVARDDGVGVELGDAAVRGPARVADADGAAEILRARLGLHFGYAPDAAHALQAAVQDGDAGGVVAAIFQALEAIDQERNDVAVGERADNATHQRRSATEKRAKRKEKSETRRCINFALCSLLFSPLLPAVSSP